MSALSDNYPWHAEFLKWHSELVIQKYNGSIVGELIEDAKTWIVRDINATIKGEE